MGLGVAEKKGKKKEDNSGWERVMSQMDRLVGLRISRMDIERRVGGIKGAERELNAKEAKALPRAAEYAAALRDALEKGSLRKIDGVA